MGSLAVRRRLASSGWSLRLVGWGVLAIVGAFHAELLAARLRDATLGEPGVAARWLLSLFVLASAAAMRRLPGRAARQRAALVVALAALLLHLGGPPSPAIGGSGGALLLALPAGLVAAFAVSLAALSVQKGRHPRVPSAASLPRERGARRRARAERAALRLPRPPPR